MSLEPVGPQKWFAYQNVQNFITDIAMIWLNISCQILRVYFIFKNPYPISLYVLLSMGIYYFFPNLH